MKRVELLAPAGSFESFQGAVHAGADAVYIGGKKYGARAYAGNFTEEEVCLAIRYAHLYGRNVYLTVNTLIKESEIEELPGYLRPFYEEGLDGVIVQDMGVCSLLREYFPDLPLHASTQMNITDAGGAAFLAEQGFSRVVPARELSLEELRRIKETGVEVEAFVHGAMCYCYSGRCLFSSMLGGRSGNRGRCAQPCRLPYQVKDGKTDRLGSDYPPCPLSLKDMCTLPILPALLQAGIDSLKIEGRMKKPEYTAGVTALYRKYIDRYYSDPDGVYAVSEKDMERLRRLYIRSDLQEGYYHRHNGREMITPGMPGYQGRDELCLQEIRETYLEKAPGIRIDGEAVLEEGKAAVFEVWYRGDGSTEACRVRQEGQTVQAAQKQPLTEDAVEKQLRRTGNTSFRLEGLTIRLDRNCFLPVKALNDLRRDALQKLEEAIRERHCRRAAEPGPNARPQYGSGGTNKKTPYVAVCVEGYRQLLSVSGASFIDRLYVNGDLAVSEEKKDLYAIASAWKQERAGRELFLAMPHIVRARDREYMAALKQELFSDDTIWDGVLLRNVEELHFLRKNRYRKKMTGDACLYTWNRRAKHFWNGLGVCVTAPLECSREDLRRLGLEGMEVIVYGRSLLMVTANCLYQTGGNCRKENGSGKAADLLLQDRYRTVFPVRAVCTHCYNEIYNSLPLSLHEYGRAVTGEYPAGIRLGFTTEGPEEIRQTLACYEDFVTAPRRRRQAEFSSTKGHFKRGAE